MPDTLTPQEQAAIATYTGPITICPPGKACAMYGDPIGPKEAMSIWRGNQARAARLRETDRG